MALPPDATPYVWPIHNDNYACTSSSPETVFEPFSRFPVEIKLLIWKASIQQNRLIGIKLGTLPSLLPAPHKYYTTTNLLGNTVSGKSYFTDLTTDHQLSPLLRTCQSSRQAALDFYRVHIPVSSQTPNTPNREIYFNPEWDFLHIETADEGRELPDFIHDLKASDAQSVGLRHIVWGNSDLNNFILPLDPSRLHPKALESFTSVLTRLWSIYFRRVASHRARWDTSFEADPKRNHSYPIRSTAESFVLTRDPRPIFNDLELIGVDVDPRSDAYVWDAMETAFGITRPAGHKVTYKYMLVTSANSQKAPQVGINSRLAAYEYLSKEDKSWKRLFQPRGLFRSIEDPDPEPAERRIESGGPMDVFGFWLFEPRAFGPLPERGIPIDTENWEWGQKFQWKCAVDLRRLNPMLGVQMLPPTHKITF